MSDICEIAIIDPVGDKAGMNYYDDNLAGELNKYRSTIVISNYVSPASKSVALFKKNANKALSVIGYLYSYAVAAGFLKKRQGKYAIHHVFFYNLISLWGLFVFRLFKIKNIVIVHDAEPLEYGRHEALRRIMLSAMTEKIVVQNTFTFNYLMGKMPFLKGKTAIIEHGNYLRNINRERCSAVPSSLDACADILAGKTPILFFGQIREKKGLDILLRAMRLLDESIVLVVAGMPREDYSKYACLIEDMRIESRIVQVLRHIADDEMEYLFGVSKLCILPYKEIYQSGVMLMAASFGVPVVASDIGYFVETIADRNNGFLFSSESPESLASVISSALSDELLLRTVAENANHQAEDGHSWVTIARKYAEMLYPDANEGSR